MAQLKTVLTIGGTEVFDQKLKEVSEALEVLRQKMAELKDIELTVESKSDNPPI